MQDINVYTAIAAGLSVVSVGAIITTVVKFLKHIERSEIRQETFLSNHMSKNTRAMERVAERLERLEDVVSQKTVHVKNADEVEVKP